ncbi:MAG TPA: cytochrome C oxidase subunit IV family protein [Candidatus Acidoferrales bacterium]|nr:cytochrome C oxidase subunit IV family protein [Candidatus Acidoferrales bacterium]
MNGHVEHTGSVKTFAMIWVSLLIFTAITVGASLVDLGPFNIVVALVIASCKALLVVLFFMEVRYSSKITKVTIVSAIFFLFLLLGLSMTDYISRGWPH